MYEQKCQYLRERLPPLAPAGIEPATVVVGKWELVRSSDFISTFSFTSPKPERKFEKGLGHSFHLMKHNFQTGSLDSNLFIKGKNCNTRPAQT